MTQKQKSQLRKELSELKSQRDELPDLLPGDEGFEDNQAKTQRLLRKIQLLESRLNQPGGGSRADKGTIIF